MISRESLTHITNDPESGERLLDLQYRHAIAMPVNRAGFKKSRTVSRSKNRQRLLVSPYFQVKIHRISFRVLLLSNSLTPVRIQIAN